MLKYLHFWSKGEYRIESKYNEVILNEGTPKAANIKFKKLQNFDKCHSFIKLLFFNGRLKCNLNCFAVLQLIEIMPIGVMEAYYLN